MTNDEVKFQLTLRDRALGQVQDLIHGVLDGLREGGLTAPQWVSTAIADLRRQTDLLDSKWSLPKHSRATALGYLTAGDWLASHHGKSRPSREAVALSRLALKYVRQHHTACPYYGDGVMEFIKGRSIVRYFHKSTLEHVFKNGWTPKTDVLVEAQWQLSMHDGPLKPPPPVSGKVKKARGK